jgi:hypothetical protein
MHSILSQCNKTRTQQQKQNRKYTNNWRLNNTLLSHQWVMEELRVETKRFLEANENENTTY